MEFEPGVIVSDVSSDGHNRLDTGRGPRGRRRSYRGLRWAIALAVLAIIGGGAYAWLARREASVRYVTAPVTRGTVSVALTATGTVNPVTVVEVGTYVSGPIVKWSCDYNARVTVGQLCAQIDPRPFQMVADQAAANLAVARAQLVKDRASLVYAKTTYERDSGLLERGIVSRRELEDSEQALATARAKLAATRQEMVVTDHSLVEALVTDRPAPAPSRQEATPMLVRYRGAARWSLAEATKIQSFFARRFGRPLPVSAWGQTPLHDRLGFDHHDAVDVAVTPDSPEGAALMAYLRNAGYSFMAFRGKVPGEATGAHIHIGDASRRVAY